MKIQRVTMALLLISVMRQLAASDTIVPASLCDVLHVAKSGSATDVIVAGTYTEGPETRVLYSTACDGRFQPATWIELSAPANEVRRLRKLLAESGQADIVVRGTLYGPRMSTAGGSVEEAAAVSQRRYGHSGLFRTKLVIHEILSMKANPTRSAPQTFAHNDVPRVTRAEMPLYPAPARIADVCGEVQLEIDVRDGVVASVRTLSGHLLLAKAARDNVRTWKFDTRTKSGLRVTYVFRLIDAAESVERELPRIEIDLPHRVVITESRSMW